MQQTRIPIITGVTIAVLVKQPGHTGAARIHYTETDDYLTRQEKLDRIESNHSVTGTEFRTIHANKHGDWIGKRDEMFGTFQALGDKVTKGKDNTQAVFQHYSSGLKTNRDAWCYNFSTHAVADNMRRMIENYNQEVEDGKTSKSVTTDPTRISWNRALLKNLDQNRSHEYDDSAVRPSLYRPFTRHAVYFSRKMNDMIYQLPRLFPTPLHPNLGITVPAGPSAQYFMPILFDAIPALTPNGGNQVFSLYTWVEFPKGIDETPSLFDVIGDDSCVETRGIKLDFGRSISEQVPATINGYERRDNVTSATLLTYRRHYADDRIDKEDIFFYVYALLHHATYRESFESDLKKMLPRIPMVPDFWEFSNIGRELADLHVNYEAVEAYPITESWALDVPSDPWQRFRVEKLSWGKRGKEKDCSRLIYNQYLTFTGIPADINDYQIGGRSPLEWLIDRYKITQDKKSGIVNDPNDYFREIGNPQYLVDLIKSLVTVTLRTQELVRALPELIIDEERLQR